jgi:hypothetical protein
MNKNSKGFRREKKSFGLPVAKTPVASAPASMADLRLS